MTTTPSRVFGSAPSGAVCLKRSAAYAVIKDTLGRVAAVDTPVAGEIKYWLPGGGMHAGETPEETVVREVREEVGRAVRLRGPLGEAIQFFYAGDEARWYEMTATFLRAEFDGDLGEHAEHELRWIDANRQGNMFFHACHAWASALA